MSSGALRAEAHHREFNPLRLELARARRGLSLTALAASADVPRRTLTRWQSVAAMPPASLEVIAAALDFPVEFFVAPDPPELPLEAASFRALTKMTASQRDAALAAGRLAFELHDWIEARFRLPDVDVPDLGKAEPETAAAMLRAKWGLGLDPIPNIIHLIEANGVRVFSLTEDNLNVDAFSLWRGGTPFIFLNTRKSAERDRIDAGHELGHLAQHRGAVMPTGRQEEEEAKRFASAFLMPPDDVRAHTPRVPTLDQLIGLKQRWGVSVAALVYRLQQLGHLSEWHARHLWIEIGSRSYRTREPRPVPRETSQLLAKVFGGMRREGIGRADIARQLRIHPQELDALIFGLIPTPLEGGGRSSSARRPSLRVVKGSPRMT